MIEVGDEEALCKAMKDVVVNKDNFNNEAMSKYIKNKFSKVIISQEIKNTYNMVLENKRRV